MGRHPKIYDATKWLQDFLAQGSQPSGQVYRQGKIDGFSERLLRNAKARLNIKSARWAGMSHWQLPGTNQIATAISPEAANAVRVILNMDKENRPRTQKDIESSAQADFFLSVFTKNASSVTFDSVLSKTIKMVRSYEHDFSTPYTETEIRQFVQNGLDAAIHDREGLLNHDKLVALIPKPEPTMVDQIADMSLAQVEQMLSIFKDVEPGTDDYKLKEALDRRRQQLTTNDEAF